MNVVALVGDIADKPKLRESALGNKFAILDVNVARPFPNSNGDYEKDTLSFMLWKGIAQTTSEVANVGDKVAIKGRIQSHTYEGNDGSTHRAYDLIAEQVSILNHQ